MKRFDNALRALWAALVAETFALCVLGGTIAASILAFGFGAEAELIAGLLLLGLLTAVAETTMRTKH